MARPTEPAWLSLCDSLRRFHVFWAAALRSSSDAHSGSVWQSWLALGDPGDRRDAHRAVSRGIRHSTTFCSSRNLDRHRFRRLAMGNGVRICKKRGTGRLAVLCCGRGKRASACSVQIFSGGVAGERVWFSRNFVHHVSGVGCRILPAGQSHRSAWDTRFHDVPFFLPNHFSRPN